MSASAPGPSAAGISDSPRAKAANVAFRTVVARRSSLTTSALTTMYTAAAAENAMPVALAEKPARCSWSGTSSCVTPPTAPAIASTAALATTPGCRAPTRIRSRSELRRAAVRRMFSPG